MSMTVDRHFLVQRPEFPHPFSPGMQDGAAGLPFVCDSSAPHWAALEAALALLWKTTATEGVE